MEGRQVGRKGGREGMMDEGAGICGQTHSALPRVLKAQAVSSTALNIVLPRLALWFMPRPARGRILVGPSVLKSIPPSSPPSPRDRSQVKVEENLCFQIPAPSLLPQYIIITTHAPTTPPTP